LDTLEMQRRARGRTLTAHIFEGKKGSNQHRMLNMACMAILLEKENEGAKPIARKHTQRSGRIYVCMYVCMNVYTYLQI
jgi:hypothetical protein